MDTHHVFRALATESHGTEGKVANFIVNDPVLRDIDIPVGRERFYIYL